MKVFYTNIYPTLFLLLLSCSPNKKINKNIFSVLKTPHWVKRFDEPRNLFAEAPTGYMYVPYPEVTKHSFWVFNTVKQPIRNATITWSHNNTSGQVTLCDSNGIYTEPIALLPGIYKVNVLAEGYEPQTQYVNIIPGSLLKARILLVKQGKEYIYFPGPFNGLIPIEKTVFTEYLSFEPKYMFHSEITDSLQKDIIAYKETLKKLTQYAPLDTSSFYQQCVPWPTEKRKRETFSKIIQESNINPNMRLSIGGCRGSTFLPYVELWISQEISEAEVYTIFDKHHLKITNLSAISTENGYMDPVWRISAMYQLPLSLDYFKAVSDILLSYPVIYIGYSAIGQVELTR